MKKALASFLLLVTLAPAATRLKELTSIEGVRDNQLMGYGLVVGLAGTGDRRQTLFSAQSLTNLLERMGITVPATAIQVKNTAAVMITAVLPPYARSGSHIDCTVAAMGDSSSLQGGVVLMTGLKAPDGQVYAVAQGPIVIGGFTAGGAANSKIVNHPTVGRIPNGAVAGRGEDYKYVHNSWSIHRKAVYAADCARRAFRQGAATRSEEHTSELQSLR